jgi:hypothetical protein
MADTALTCVDVCRHHANDAELDGDLREDSGKVSLRTILTGAKRRV